MPHTAAVPAIDEAIDAKLLDVMHPSFSHSFTPDLKPAVSPLPSILSSLTGLGLDRMCCNLILFLVLFWFLWSPYVIGQTIIFSSCSFFLLSSFFSSPNLSGRRLDVYHTSTHSVALVRI